MHNTPRARFLVRLRKVTWLLPLAVVAGIAVVERAGFFGSANGYLPPWARVAFLAAASWARVGWVLLTLFCSARVAARITKARKISNVVGVFVTLLLGIFFFFCYLYVAALMLPSINSYKS